MASPSVVAGGLPLADVGVPAHGKALAAGMGLGDAAEALAKATTPPAPPGPRVRSFYDSGPIVATSGQTIAYVRIRNPNGPCILVPPDVTGVTIRDSDIGPCAGEANIFVLGGETVVEHTDVHDGVRGVYAISAPNVVVRSSRFTTFRGPLWYQGKAIEYNYADFGLVQGNVLRGEKYQSDVVGVFESSFMKLLDNDFDVQIDEPSSVAFTIGDSTRRRPGAHNYAAGNIVRQRGGVPAGVFGSNGDTVIERNCFTGGIQAYNYSGVFIDVTVRDNVIDFGRSFVPNTAVVNGWNTNINSTDCSLLRR